MSVKNYDAKKVIMTFGGYTLSGFDDGSFISVERNEDMWTLKVGASGEGCRSKSNNRSGRVTFTAIQSSASNDILSAFAKVDEASNAGVQPLLIKDLNGTTLCSAQTAWIVKIPTAGYDKEAGSREWVIETDDLEMFVGGNA